MKGSKIGFCIADQRTWVTWSGPAALFAAYILLGWQKWGAFLGNAAWQFVDMWRISMGDVPYRDLPMPYGSFSLIFYAMLWRIFPRFELLWIFNLAVIAAVGTLVAVLACRLSGPRASPWAAAVFFISAFGFQGSTNYVIPDNYASVHGMLFALFLCWQMDRLMRSPSKSGWWLLGLFLGLALCGKLELGVACAGTVACFFVLEHWRSGEGAAAAFSRLLLLAAGTLLIPSFILFYVLSQTPWSVFVERNLDTVAGLVSNEPYEFLGWRGILKMLALIGLYSAAEKLGRRPKFAWLPLVAACLLSGAMLKIFFSLSVLDNFFLLKLFCFLSAWLALIYGLFHIWTRPLLNGRFRGLPVQDRLALYVCLLACALFSRGIIQGLHYANQVLAPGILTAVFFFGRYVFAASTDGASMRIWRWFRPVPALMVIAYFAWTSFDFYRRTPGLKAETRFGTVYLSRNELYENMIEAAKIMKEKTSPGERIFASLNPLFYVLADRLPITYDTWVLFWPYISPLEGRALQKLQEASPSYLVFGHQGAELGMGQKPQEVYFGKHYGLKVKEWIERHYRPIWTQGSGLKAVSIYERRPEK